jgi:hypothetical protein
MKEPKEYETPLDDFEDSTVSVFHWIEMAKRSDFLGRDPEKRVMIFAKAYKEVVEMVKDTGLRQLPRVGYDPESDSSYFIFKFDHAGRTVTVPIIETDQ